MPDVIHVLVIDDQEEERDTISEGFNHSDLFQFKIQTAGSVEEAVELIDRRQQFDIVVIDLSMRRTEAEASDDSVIDLSMRRTEAEASDDSFVDSPNSDDQFDGFPVLVAVNAVIQSGFAVIYSAKPAVKNVVRAMRLGAADFVSKRDYPPHEFVKRVEKLLQRRQRRSENQRSVNAFIVEHQTEWAKTKPGMFLAIAVDESLSPAQARVVAEGRSRLEALVKYDRLRSENGWRKYLPLDPHLHLVPESRP